jgi:hypothetical protein
VRIVDLWFSGFILLVAIGYEVMALWMPRGSLKFPGPGYYPMLAGIFLIATALGCLIQALLAHPPAKASAPATGEARGHPRGKTAALLGLLAAYGLLLKPLGFPIALPLFLLVAIRAFGYRRWPVIALLAIGLTLVSYLTFVTWLKVPLPLGVAGDLMDYLD